MERDWLEWHAPYDEPDSDLSRRLGVVQRLLADAFDRGTPGRIDLISVCAGQGHDVCGVLADHPRATDVHGLLVEWDPRNVEAARARAIGFDGVEVARADAGMTTSYAGATPADVVLLCGVFGNVSDADIEHTIRTLPELCAPGATVLWTRHRHPPDVTPTIERWFEESGFERVEVVRPEDSVFCVGAHRFVGETRPTTTERLFRFVGFDELLS